MEDIRKKLRLEVAGIIKEEKVYGVLADPKEFDPIDPEINVAGFGTYSRTALRKGIASRLKAAAVTAEKAANGGPMSHSMYRNLRGILGEMSALYYMVQAELDVSEQLESIRKKGGRRDQPIPKQY
jgi:hypothetical protein